jgi:hypothetical protein
MLKKPSDFEYFKSYQTSEQENARLDSLQPNHDFFQTIYIIVSYI